MKFYKTPSFEDAYTTSHFLERLLIEASSSLFLKRFCLALQSYRLFYSLLIAKNIRTD